MAWIHGPAARVAVVRNDDHFEFDTASVGAGVQEGVPIGLGGACVGEGGEDIRIADAVLAGRAVDPLSIPSRLLRYLLGTLAVLVVVAMVLDIAFAGTFGLGFVFAQASYWSLGIAAVCCVSGPLALRMAKGLHPLLESLLVGGAGAILAMTGFAVWAAVAAGTMAAVPWALLLGFWPSTAFIGGIAFAIFLASRPRAFTVSWIATAVALVASVLTLVVLSMFR